MERISSVGKEGMSCEIEEGDKGMGIGATEEGVGRARR